MLLKERFDKGLEFPEYLRTVVDKKEDWHKNYQDFQLSEGEKKKLSAITKQLNIMALAEDWCGDAVRNLPVIAKMVEALADAKLKVFPRDQNPDLMDKFVVNGKRKIPTLVFLDQNFRLLAVWIEKPANADQLREKFRAEEEGQQKYLSALKQAVKEEIFSLLEEIKDR